MSWGCSIYSHGTKSMTSHCARRWAVLKELLNCVVSTLESRLLAESSLSIHLEINSDCCPGWAVNTRQVRLWLQRGVWAAGLSWIEYRRHYVLQMSMQLMSVFSSWKIDTDCTSESWNKITMEIWPIIYSWWYRISEIVCQFLKSSHHCTCLLHNISVSPGPQN